jgi:hypothetical protein
MKQPVGRPCLCLMALAAFALVASGCGGSENTKTYPVKGKLEVNGQPAGGVTLVFITDPPDETKTYIPMAVTESDGSFSVSTFRSKDGAPAANYKVSLFWPEWRKGFKISSTDRLNKEFDGNKTPLKATVEAKDNELPPFQITAELKPLPDPNENSEKKDAFRPRRGKP